MRTLRRHGERKARKRERKEAFKALPPAQKWKRRGIRLLKVVGIIAGVIVIIAIIMTISFEVRHAEIAPAHSATEAHDQHASESTLEAYTSLQSNGDGLYVSNSGVGWDQTDTSESGQEVWQATTESTEPFEIMSVYCAPCHTKEELGLYRADAGRARAKVVSMAEDYGCSSLTDEQVGVLSEFYTEEEGE